jgi:hypothetical protein
MSNRKRCPNGTRRNKQTGNCESIQPIQIQRKKCPKGTRRNKQTGNCDSTKKHISPITSPSKLKKMKSKSPKLKNPKTKDKSKSPKSKSPKTKDSKMQDTITISYRLPIQIHGRTADSGITKPLTLKQVIKKNYPLDALKDKMRHDRNNFVPYHHMNIATNQLKQIGFATTYQNQFVDVISNDIEFVTHDKLDFVDITITMRMSKPLENITMEDVEQLIYDSFTPLKI